MGTISYLEPPSIAVLVQESAFPFSRSHQMPKARKHDLKRRIIIKVTNHLFETKREKSF